jgi:hypothetical protein
MGKGAAKASEDPAQDPSAAEPPDPAGVQGLTDIARGMQHAAQSSQDVQGQQFLTVLSHYFDPDTGEPLEFRITLPDGQVWDIPLIACFPPSAIGLTKFTSRYAVDIHQAEVRQGRYHRHMPALDRARFKVAFAPSDPNNVRRKSGHGRTMDVELTFEAEEKPKTPEIIRRIIALYTDLSVPMTREEADKHGKRVDGAKRLAANLAAASAEAAAPTTEPTTPPPPSAAPDASPGA